MKYTRLGALLAAALLFSGCTAQSVPLEQRALVRLVYLDTAGEDFLALCAVCDFGADREEEERVVWQQACAATPAQALQQAAAAGQRPFFAQNELLLLSPALAEKQAETLLGAAAGAVGVYRNPAVWLWEQGPAALTGMEDPVQFIRLAEELTREDAAGLVLRVLDSAVQHTSRIPILRCAFPAGRAPELTAQAAVQGRALTGSAMPQGAGLLRGRVHTLTLTVPFAGQTCTVTLEKLRRHITAENGRLRVDFSGYASVLPRPQPGPQTRALQEKINAKLTGLCRRSAAELARAGEADPAGLAWWEEQLGTGRNDPEFTAQIRMR